MTRQSDYQEKKIRMGLCRQCGKGKLPPDKVHRRATRCEECRIKMKKRHALNVLSRRQPKND